MTDTVAAALAPVINGEINLLADHGPWWFLTIHAIGLTALWCGLGAAIHIHDRRRSAAAVERPLYDPEPPERMPVAPDAMRRAVRPENTDNTTHDEQQEGARP
ncbi:hypothetical protein ABT215_11240 [Streptomyces sp900105755]|uniref:hypothetical protein n=1 Tax=Streptomyces sp. 900105755 TaxID=3154389 RepID=UPI00331E4331